MAGKARKMHQAVTLTYRGKVMETSLCDAGRSADAVRVADLAEVENHDQRCFACLNRLPWWGDANGMA